MVHLIAWGGEDVAKAAAADVVALLAARQQTPADRGDVWRASRVVGHKRCLRVVASSTVIPAGKENGDSTRTQLRYVLRRRKEEAKGPGYREQGNKGSDLLELGIQASHEGHVKAVLVVAVACRVHGWGVRRVSLA